MLRVITIPASDRPNLLRDTLASLATNDLEDWHISIGVEPGPRAAEIAAVCRERFGPDRCSIAINESVLGVRVNPRRLIERAFDAGASLVLHVEDDLVLAPDATRLARWYDENHRPAWLCLNLLAGACGSAGMLSDRRFPRAIVESRTFNSIGFAVRQPEWSAHMLQAWRSNEGPEVAGGWAANWRTHAGWDWSVWGILAVNAGLRSVQPVLARANHRGRVGVHARPEFHQRAFDHIEIATAAERDYDFLSSEAIPREIRSHLNLFEELTELRLAEERAAIRVGEAEIRRDIAERSLAAAARDRPRRLMQHLRRVFGVG